MLAANSEYNAKVRAGMKMLLKLSAILFCLLLSPMVFADSPPLIPRETLMGNPVKAAVRIAPDGQKYSYIAPSREGVLNIWVQDVKKTKPVEMITNDTHRGIRDYAWAKDNKHILYTQDINGNENWHVYAVDLNNKAVRDLTPFEEVRAENMIVHRNFPDQILVGLNLRDRHVFDMYRINLNTGKVTLDTKNPGDVENWLADDNFQIRAAVAVNGEDGSSILRTRENLNSPWRDIITWPFGESGGLVTFSKDGKTLTITSTLGSNTMRLLEIDPTSGKTLKVLASDPKSDINDVLINENTREVQAVQFDYLKPEWKVLDPTIKDDFAILNAKLKGVYQITSRDKDDRLWAVSVLSDVNPGSFYFYDRANKQLQFLFASRPELEKYHLAKMQPVIIPTQDNMQLVAYLTLPAGKTSNLPMVLDVHGGPWARDDWGYDAESQWLANRGYAVLQVNFRGSTGLGKQYLNAGNKQWGTGKMQQDLTDSVAWAVKKKIADAKKVCIYGGSYGGYATLAGLVFTPTLYACGVDLVGPSNLRTLLASIPPYWKNTRKEMLLRMGDVEKDAALNQKISPLFHVDNIRVPLLIGQGAHDPRVNIEQAAVVVKAMRAKKLPVEYIVYTDEGHGFARPENRLDFYGRMEEFLAKYIGGRAQPMHPVPGSSAEVK